MKKQILYWTLSIATGLTCFSSIPDTPDPKKNAAVTEKEFDEILFSWTRTWAEVMQLVKQKHYKVVAPENCMSRALDTFLNTLDPHSNFLDPKAYESMLGTTAGEFFGIGIVIDNTRKTKDRSLTVVEVIPEGPAEKAGMQQYDKIVEVDGASLEGLTTDEIIKKMRGERGTSVTIKTMREGHQELLTFQIMRDSVKNQDSLSFHIKGQNIYYLSLITFSQNAITQMTQLMEKASKEPYRGIILDLRNNSGGLLNAVVDIAGLFVPKDSVITITKDKHDTVTGEYKTTKDPIANPAIPIIILINNYTASAAEILAGCLKFYAEQNNKSTPPLVFLVGTPSFGKGSVQEVIPVSNNSAITLTTSLYFFPDNSTIQGVGITPDFVVERYLPPTEQIKWFTQSYGREKTLENYITINKESKEENKEEKPSTTDQPKAQSLVKRIKDMLQTDNQLREAIIMMQIINTALTSSPESMTSRASALEYLKTIYSTDLDIQEIKA